MTFDRRKIEIRLRRPLAHLIPDDMVDKDLAEVTNEQMEGFIGSVEQASSNEPLVVLEEATRAGNARRMRALGAARRWKLARLYDLMREDGHEDPKPEDADDYELLPEDAESYDILIQASAIIGSIVPGECENFDVPENIEDWLEVPDWIFDPLLENAVLLNTHWTSGLVQKNLIRPR